MCDFVKQVSSSVGWGLNFAIPAANNENLKLISKYEQLVVQKQETEDEYAVLHNRVNAMHIHLKDVQRAVSSAVSMFQEKCNNNDAEELLFALAYRELTCIKKDLRQFSNKRENIQDQIFKFENEIFAKKMKLRNIMEELHIDARYLEDWLQYAEQECDDIYTLKCFERQDASNISRLAVTVEKLSSQKANIKQRLAKTCLNGDVIKMEMERISIEARDAVNERRETLDQWEKTLKHSETRRKENESNLQAYGDVCEEVNRRKRKLREQESLLQNIQMNSKDITKEKEHLENDLIEMRQRRAKYISEVDETTAQLKAIRRCAEKCSFDLEKARAGIKLFQRDVISNSKRLRKLQQDIIRLDEVASRIKELKLSADQLVAEAELQLEKETANAADLTRCLDVLSKRKFKNAQERSEVIDDKHRTEKQFRACNAEIKYMQSRLRKANDQAYRQEKIIYGQDLEILHIEKKIRRLEENGGDDTCELLLQKMNEKLSSDLDAKMQLHSAYVEELKILQSELARSSREAEKLVNLKKLAEERREDDEIYIEQTQKLIKDKKQECNRLLVDKTMVQLRLSRMNKQLESHTEEVFTLEKERVDMEFFMKEKSVHFNAHLDMVNAELRIIREENAKLALTIIQRKLRIDKLTRRFEIESLKMASPEGEDVRGQTYYAIKALQKIDETKQFGANLNAEVAKLETELDALQNTLLLLQESNKSLSAGSSETDKNDANKEKDALTGQLNDLKKESSEKRQKNAAIRINIGELKKSLETSEEKITEAEIYESELRKQLRSAKSDEALLSERLERAARAIKRVKTAPVTHTQDDSPNQEAITLDIEAQLARDLVRNVAALILSNLRGNSEAEERARIYLSVGRLYAPEKRAASRQNVTISRNPALTNSLSSGQTTSRSYSSGSSANLSAGW